MFIPISVLHNVTMVSLKEEDLISFSITNHPTTKNYGSSANVSHEILPTCWSPSSWSRSAKERFTILALTPINTIERKRKIEETRRNYIRRLRKSRERKLAKMAREKPNSQFNKLSLLNLNIQDFIFGVGLKINSQKECIKRVGNLIRVAVRLINLIFK